MKNLLAVIIFFSFLCQAWVPLTIVPIVTDVAKEGAALGVMLTSDGTKMPNCTTTLRIGHDGQAIKVLAVCQEPHTEALYTAHRTNDDRVWADDCVEVFIQPKGWSDYAHCVFNSAGTRYDARATSSHDTHVEWNSTATAKIGIQETQWTIEITIPFTDLGGAPAPGDEWKMNVCRSRVVSPELSCWSPTHDGKFHDPLSFGVIRFSNDAYPKRITWQRLANKRGTLSLEWNKEVKTENLLNGSPLPLDGHFDYDSCRLTRIELESTVADKTILRCAYVIGVNPVAVALGDAADLLATLPPNVEKELRQEIATARAIFDATAADKQEVLMPLARILFAKARSAAMHHAFTAKGRADDEIPYTVENSLEKHLRHDRIGGDIAGTIHLDAARNEMDAAQIILFSGESTLLMTQASVDGDLKDDHGHILPENSLRLRRIGYILTCKPGYKVDFVGQWPDPLMDCTPFDIAPYAFETIWADVRVPVGTKPGLYRGSITVTAMNSNPTKVPVEIRVRNFTIPRKPSIVTAFGIHYKWRLPQDMDAYIDNLLEHRISPYNTVTAPKLIRPALLDLRKANTLAVKVKAASDADLAVTIVLEDEKKLHLPEKPLIARQAQTVTFSADELPQVLLESIIFRVKGTERAELEATLTMKDGTVRQLVEHSASDGIQWEKDWLSGWINWVFNADQCPDLPAIIDWREYDEKFELALTKGLTSNNAYLYNGGSFSFWTDAYQKHLTEKGWLKYFYTYLNDEPEPEIYPMVNERHARVKRTAPGTLKNMMTARAFPPELRFVDIWCPEMYSFNAELAKKEQELGRNVWWYVAFGTRPPLPNVWIEHPLIESRVWPWMSWKYNLDGMLYYSTCYWQENDPWRTGETFRESNGDGSLLYPGNDGVPYDSIRWECLRDGMEDYEVFCLLEAAQRDIIARFGKENHAELLKEIARNMTVSTSVVNTCLDYNRDYSELLNSRRAMSDCLEAAVNLLGYEPVITGRPHYRSGRTAQETAASLEQMRQENQKLMVDANPSIPTPKLEPADGLRLFYSFDSDLTFIFDCSGNKNHAQVSRSQRVPNGFGKAIEIRERGFVFLPREDRILGKCPLEGTIEFDVRPNLDPATLKYADDQHCKQYLFNIMLDNGRLDGKNEIGIYAEREKLCVRFGTDDTTFGEADSPLKNSQWAHLTLTWKPGLRQLYVDGKLLFESKAPYSVPNLSTAFYTLGAAYPGDRRFVFNGAFDNLKIWNHRK